MTIGVQKERLVPCGALELKISFQLNHLFPWGCSYEQALVDNCLNAPLAHNLTRFQLEADADAVRTLCDLMRRIQAVHKRKRPRKAGVSRLNQSRKKLLLLEVVVAGFARAAYDAELLFEAGFVTR